MICGATGSLAVLVPGTVQMPHGKVLLFYAAAWVEERAVGEPLRLVKEIGWWDEVWEIVGANLRFRKV